MFDEYYNDDYIDDYDEVRAAYTLGYCQGERSCRLETVIDLCRRAALSPAAGAEYLDIPEVDLAEFVNILSGVNV